MITVDELRPESIRCKKLLNVIRSYSGDTADLSNAIGFHFIGLFFGWRYLYMIHGKKTVKKYEQVLDIKVSKEFDPISTESCRSEGLNRVFDKQLNYWKVVSGDIKAFHSLQMPLE